MSEPAASEPLAARLALARAMLAGHKVVRYQLFDFERYPDSFARVAERVWSAKSSSTRYYWISFDTCHYALVGDWRIHLNTEEADDSAHTGAGHRGA